MRVLEADRLVKEYRADGKKKKVVDTVSLSIDEGEVLAFLGRNGAGKTTTIKMISSLVRPTSGRVRVLGEDPHADPRALRHIGAVLEGSRNVYWRFTAEENLEYFGALRGLSRKVARQRGGKLLERFGLSDQRNVPLMRFSRGMQQKVAIMVALLHEPKLLLLDEPTIALDVEAAQKVKELIVEIAAEGRAVLLTTHHLDVAEEVAHRVAIIDQGRLLVEEPAQDLIERFSGRAYRIVFRGEVGDARRAKLTELGAEVDGDSLVYRGAPTELYTLLEVLRPLPLMKVADDRDTLTKIFLDLTNENHARSLSGRDPA